MEKSDINLRSRTFYSRYYRLSTLAVVIMVAVITGSLVLGDSVRGTLMDRVRERLGNTQTVIATQSGFLSDSILSHPSLSGRAFLMLEGFIPCDGKMLPVQVFGMEGDSIERGTALVNQPLRQRISGEEIVLRLPAHNMVPSGTLFVTQTYSTQMRLAVKGVRSMKEGGNILLRNEQTLPLNVFVNHRELGEVMDLKGRVNIIMADRMLTEDDFSSIWNPTLSGIHVRKGILTADRIFLPSQWMERLRPSETYFSYLVNDIVHASDSVPYSFITAADKWQGRSLGQGDIILSDYAARRLKAGVGDTVSMSYFTTHDLKRLTTMSRSFRVSEVVPIEAFASDSSLMAEFPGLSNVERCADWDSDLPIQMGRIHKEDEDFWYAFHQTPKALVSLSSVAPDWCNSYGSATAYRLGNPTLEPSALRPSDVGIMLFHPYEAGLDSAAHGTDFAALFLALGFFIILSAVLLLQSPLSEMMMQRQSEADLYECLGFSRSWTRGMLMREGLGVLLKASPLGVITGVAYAGLTLFLLSTVWSGATNTEGFMLHLKPLTLLVSWLVGMLISAFVLWSAVCFSQGAKSVRGPSRRRYRVLLTVGGVLLSATLATVLLNFLLWHSIVVFVLAGLTWVIAFGFLFEAELCRRLLYASTVGRDLCVLRSLHASLRTGRLTYWSLSLGVFSVFAVGLNRPDFSDSRQMLTATGGYDLYVQCRVPLQYDLNDSLARHRLKLSSLPDGMRFLQFMRHSQDEASCLNLNKVATPTVLGTDLSLMRSFGLQSLSGEGVYVDEESLLWSMMMEVGDTIVYQDSRGDSVPLPILGTYPTGIFHGNAIMDSRLFARLWPEEKGTEVFLASTNDGGEAAELLAIALSEYGLDMQTTVERMQMFFRVTQTYLVIFLTLGGIGLLLGIFCLVIVVRKNLLARQPEVKQLWHMGFGAHAIRRLLLIENLAMPVYAILVGGTGSIISISANVAGAGWATIASAIALIVLIVLVVVKGIREMTERGTPLGG